MMDAVRSIKNQYLGINAHLQSAFQAQGGWDSFHTLHIGQLASAMQSQLRALGYTAAIEESLQIRRIGESDRYPVSDVLIADQDRERAGQPHSAAHDQYD